MEALFREDAYLKYCTATVTVVDERGIRLDRTVFYPTGGGQPGDTGRLRLEDGTEIAIRDAVKGTEPGEIIHVPAEGARPIAAGTQVTAEIDWDRRHRLMRMHTCLHLLSSIVPGEVTGGQVSDGKGRLDFNLPEGSPEKDKITAELQRLVAEDHPTGTRWITDEEMAARPELVRTMSVKPPMGQGRVRLLEIEGVDLQPCGGTHVARTGEIGGIECVKIESKGKMNRRINLALKD
ncbi:MAG TPA: alanyl-tRNA editing protein [Dongiaceae bacterium]